MEPKKPHTEVDNPRRPRATGGNESAVQRARIAAIARTKPKEKFTSLLHHLTPELVRESLYKTPLNSAPGTDGMTVEQARSNLDWLLPEIMRQIHRGVYEAPPVRRVLIPKADGKQRPIGVPQVIDRAIQASLASILNEIYEQDFLPCSFGFRPGLGCHHALATINHLMFSRGMNFALEVDIRDFFGSLQHGWLRRFLELRIGDRRVLKLIDAWLQAGVIEHGTWRRNEQGTPQGGSISPILANAYLHYVLDLWFERKIKRRLRGEAHLVRYCDDFVILCKDQGDLATVRTLLKARLSQFGLAMADEKTHETDLRPGSTGQGHSRHRMEFLGFAIFRSKSLGGKSWKVTFQTEGRRFSRAKHQAKDVLEEIRHWPIGDQAKRINALLRGHYNYYGIAGNSRRVKQYYWQLLRLWRRSLSQRSQNGAVNWTRMNTILSQYPLAMPKITLSYSGIGSYVRL